MHHSDIDNFERISKQVSTASLNHVSNANSLQTLNGKRRYEQTEQSTLFSIVCRRCLRFP